MTYRAESLCIKSHILSQDLTTVTALLMAIRGRGKNVGSTCDRLLRMKALRRQTRPSAALARGLAVSDDKFDYDETGRRPKPTCVCAETSARNCPVHSEPKPAAPACPECVKFYGEFATYHCKHKEPKPAEPEALLREFWISKHEHEILEHEPDCLELYIHVREVPK